MIQKRFIGLSFSLDCDPPILCEVETLVGDEMADGFNGSVGKPWCSHGLLPAATINFGARNFVRRRYLV